jgi:phosphoribosylformylglycinamidine synthase
MKLSILGRSPAEIRAETAGHGLRLPPEEWLDLAGRLGRDPTVAEGFLFDVALSEHCSYKSSRRFLKAYLPPSASHVILGPGEDAGIVSLGLHGGEEWGLVVAHESHNHPSQVLPVEGAATGIGGIVRDVYCMGADVVGVLDGLRFGDPDGPNAIRVKAIARGVIQGISEYGNALGVPNLGGDCVFHPGFDDNCLVNVVAFGVLPVRRILRSRVPPEARTRPFVLILVGKPTDDTGLGGASFASVVLDEADAGENRGAVQIHDPFLKRVLVEATHEAIDWLEREKIPAGCKDLGAAGLGGASSELVMASGFGAEIDLSLVPPGIPGLGPHQVLCAETQERFAWAVPEERAEEFCRFFNESYELGRIYPGAAARVIGRVVVEPVYRCTWRGDVVVDLPTAILEHPPVLNRKTAPRTGDAPVADPSPPGEDRAAWALALLSSWDAALRAPVYRFYDQEVRGEAFLRPGESDAGVCRPLPGSRLGVAVSLDGNPHYGALDAYGGGALAVLESVRNCVATGARPWALTDCLNFGSPEDPVCLGDFESALRGMADACRAVGCPGRPEEPLPLVSGNVSFYNQSATGRAVPPSPIVACFGLLDDYATAITRRLHASGNAILLTGRRARAWGAPASSPGGRIPEIDFDSQVREIRAVLALTESGVVRAAHDIADGGLLRAAWEMVADEDGPGPRGLELDLSAVPAAAGMPPHEVALSETPGFLLEVSAQETAAVLAQLREAGVEAAAIGCVTPQPRFCLRSANAVWCDPDPAVLHRAWRTRLESITHTVTPAGAGGEE